MKFKYLVENEDYALGQRLWVLDRSMSITVLDKDDEEIFSGKLKDFLIPKNEKYLQVPSKLVSSKANMVFKLMK